MRSMGAFVQVLRQYGVLIVALGVTVAASYMVVHFFGDTNSLPALALSGIVVLLGALLVFTTLMSVSGLSDKTQALGLPDGSVRAIIAIALVGMFTILASSVLQTRHEETRFGLSDENITKFHDLNPTAKDVVVTTTSKAGIVPKEYGLSFASSSAQAPDEFAKQMLTLLGTLMTALTAFYFGGRTAGSAVGTDISRAAPELTGIEDGATVKNGTSPPVADPLALTLTGTNLNSIRAVRLAKGVAPRVEIDAVSALSNANRVTCVFPARAELNAEGVWDATVVDDIGRTSTKMGLLTLKNAAGASLPPLPKQVTPSPASSTQLSFSVLGTGLKGIKKVSLSLDGATWISAPMVSSPTDTEVLFGPLPSPLAPGRWIVRLEYDAGKPIDLDQRLEIN